MRTGLKCSHWERNMIEVIKSGATVNLMCTYNVLCVTNFTKLLEKVIEWRKQFSFESVSFDTPYLKEPPHWMINILPVEFVKYQEETLNFIQDNQEWFSEVEYEKFKRVTDYMKENPISLEKIQQGRRDFYSFFSENDRRLGTSLLETFPEYSEFYKLCKNIYDAG